MSFAARFEVHLIQLDPTRGSEVQKTRPCVVVSPNEMNRHLKTVIIAPLTSSPKQYPSRVPVSFEGRLGAAALDQLRTVDKERLVKKLGSLRTEESRQVLQILRAMFAE